MVKVLKFISLYSLMLMVSSKNLLHIDTPECNNIGPVELSPNDNLSYKDESYEEESYEETDTEENPISRLLQDLSYS